MKDLTLKLIIDECTIRLDSMARTTNSQMAKFLERMENPDHRVYAFQWCEGAIEEAVRRDRLETLRIYATSAQEHVAEGKTTEEEALKNIREYFDRETMNRATRTNRSTSSMSNLVDDHELAMNARISSWLRGDYFSGF